MSKWHKTVNIKEILEADSSPEAVVKAAHGIAGRLRAKLSRELDPQSSDFDLELEDITDRLESMSTDDEGLLYEFNGTLAELYDWGDSRRVWMGP